MKSKLLSGFGVLLIAGSMFAPLPARAEAGEHPGRFRERAEHMKKELGLSDEQSARMREIFQASRDERSKQLAEVLTPEQREKFRSMKEKHKAARQERKKQWCEKSAG